MLSASLNKTFLSLSLPVSDYTIIGGDEELPLGEEFQSLVRCFVTTQEKKVDKRYGPAAKLIEQL